jgi:plasmid stabilization system protein ParE
MRYSVVVASTAEANLDDIFHFIALDNPSAAGKVVASLRAKMKTLAHMPRRCPLAPEDGLDGLEIRHLIFGNYRILFTIDAREVTIFQVRHGARLPFGEE